MMTRCEYNDETTLLSHFYYVKSDKKSSSSRTEQKDRKQKKHAHFTHHGSSCCSASRGSGCTVGGHCTCHHCSSTVTAHDDIRKRERDRCGALRLPCGQDSEGVCQQAPRTNPAALSNSPSPGIPSRGTLCASLRVCQVYFSFRLCFVCLICEFQRKILSFGQPKTPRTFRVQQCGCTRVFLCTLCPFRGEGL